MGECVYVHGDGPDDADCDCSNCVPVEPHQFVQSQLLRYEDTCWCDQPADAEVHRVSPISSDDGVWVGTGHGGCELLMGDWPPGGLRERIGSTNRWVGRDGKIWTRYESVQQARPVLEAYGMMFRDSEQHCDTCTCGCTCGYGGQHDDINPRCALNTDTCIGTLERLHARCNV